MNPAVQAALTSWRLDPGLLLALALTGAIYLRGWRALHRQMPDRFGPWRLAAFAGGLAVIFAAVASPLDAFASLLLSVHMTQHLLLTMLAPPLLWLGAPAIPLLRGLPPGVARDALGPFLAWPALRRACRTLSHPVVCWLAFVATTWTWHLPSLYELALRSPGWHQVEHASFLAAALLFWWPVVQPWPSESPWPRWAVIPYLALADLQNTAFSALLSFGERVIYPSYGAAPRLLDLSPIEDQALAGAVMWVPGSIAFLAPVGLILLRLLGEAPVRVAAPGASAALATAERLAPRRGSFDVLAVPGLGTTLSRLGTRRAAQALLLLAAAAVVADGFLGPQVAPMNLAGVLPWTYFRGFLVIALLAAGNLFCFACPFMLPRELARRLRPASRRWPRALRSKWLAIGLLAVWLWVYEAFDPWDSPWWTAWITVAYFAAAFAVDGVFRGASFCKYVCPLGQFQFVLSTVSPLEVRVRRAATCATCRTLDCIRGNAASRGCETDLFLPHKVGNLDCTFCLDCVRACPHDNIGLLAVVPASDLARDPARSSLGRLSRRPDVVGLALALVFGAFANAAGMIAPVARGEEAFAAWLGVDSPLAATAIGLAVALVLVPALAAVACGALGRGLAALLGRRSDAPAPPLREVALRFSLTLVPLGLAMWAAHFLFHLVSGAATALPVVQRVALDAGVSGLGEPSWAGAAAAAAFGAGWLPQAKLALLDAGLLLTLYVAWRVARDRGRPAAAAVGLLVPWGGLATALWAAGVWLCLQPMQMRGMMFH